LLHRGELPVRAKSGCEQPQQTTALFDHLVGAGEHGWGNFKAKRFGGLEIDG
jgi:hypothetical protein